MNKIEAIQALSEGKKLTHHLFGDDEFVMMSEENGTYKFEDGVKQFEEEFWKIRKDASWLTDWEIKG
jgi:hypothetical protein